MSINQLIASAVSEKLAALMTEEYLEQRAKRGHRSKYDAVLKRSRTSTPRMSTGSIREMDTSGRARNSAALLLPSEWRDPVPGIFIPRPRVRALRAQASRFVFESLSVRFCYGTALVNPGCQRVLGTIWDGVRHNLVTVIEHSRDCRSALRPSFGREQSEAA